MASNPSLMAVRIQKFLSAGLFSVLGVSGTVGILTHKAAIAADLPGVSTLTEQASSTAQTVLIVSPALGNDATADGTDRAPFRTITRALQVAQPNTVILLTPGTYSAETGETFPIVLKPGVGVQGNPEARGQGILIRGSGSFLSRYFARQNVTILGANQSALVGVTVTNPTPQGYGVWVESTSPVLVDNTFTESTHDGISVVGDSAPLIRNNYFYRNGANGITIYGTSRPEVRENIFEQTGFGININQKAAPRLIGNRITQNKDGVVVQASATPILRFNSIERNERDGIVAIAQSRPDLGTAGEPGGNIIRSNGQNDVNAKASNQQIPAFGNEMVKQVGNLDLNGTAVATSTGIGVSRVPVQAPALPQPSISSPAPQPTPAIAPAPQSTPVAENPPPVAPTPAASPTRLALPAVSVLPANSDASASIASASAGRPAGTDRPGRPIVSVLSENADAAVPLAAQPGTTPNPPEVTATAPNRDRKPPEATPNVSRTPASARDAISAASFPVPGVSNATKPSNPAAAVSSPVDFPAPTALSRPAEKPASSPIQAISISTPQSLPTTQFPPAQRSASAPSPGVSRPTRAVPTISATFPSPVQTPQPRSIAPAASLAAPIAIPVPAPARSAPPVNLAPLKPPVSPVPVRSVRVSQPGSIEIPVPPPETRSPVAANPPALAAATNPPDAQRLTVMGLLPVPSSQPPLGNIGSMPAVNVYRNARQRDTANPPIPPTVASAAGVRYRVVADAQNEQQQARVQSLVPRAFRTFLNGRMVMQIGAFGDRSKANELMQQLQSQGINATVEEAR